jgi:hypothetical protein
MIDDSPQVFGVNFSIADSQVILGLRCREKKTEAAFGARFTYFGMNDSIKVLTRINDGQPVETTWTGG